MNAYPAVCQPLRVVFDSPATGAENMARDECLLASAVADRAPTLRFYGWVEPTLSLGYFQRYADRARHGHSRACPVVRRLSGGGAIVHQHELTYCLALPARHSLAGDTLQLYQVVHRTLVASLDQFGVGTRLRRGSAGAGRRSEPFLCFRRQADGDVLLGSFKVAGSAQRRRRGAVLQHGSVLLGRCQAAPELPGIAELAGIELDSARLAEAWVERLTAALDVPAVTPRPYLAEESAVTKNLEKKYAAARWTERR